MASVYVHLQEVSFEYLLASEKLLILQKEIS